MSRIFTTTTDRKPRADAKIRVKAYLPGSVEESGEYLEVDLLEFHPDFGTDMKFRGYALVRPRDELRRPEHAHIYALCGQGFLAEPYMHINELFLHEGDMREIMEWSRQHGYAPLIIHRCPLPFPVFQEGTQVVVVEDSKNNGRFAGRTGVITSSSVGGQSGVKFNDGIEWHFDSLHLRELVAGQHSHDIRKIRRSEKKEKL